MGDILVYIRANGMYGPPKTAELKKFLFQLVGMFIFELIY
jgi:hypothetical protein